MLRLMGSMWCRKRAARQLTPPSSLKKSRWRKAQSASQAGIPDVTFVHLHLDFKVLVLTFDVLFFTFPEWGGVGTRHSGRGPAALATVLPCFWCHTTQHWYTAVKAAIGHIVVCVGVCVCRTAMFHDKWEGTLSNCWNTVALPILWVRMDAPSRGGGDGSMHLAEFWWKVKIVSITLLWPSKQQATHTREI